MKTETVVLARPAPKPRGAVLPVAAVCLIILVVWYVAAIPMNWVITGPKIEAAGGGLSNTLAFSWNEQRPVLPSPHQIIIASAA